MVRVKRILFGVTVLLLSVLARGDGEALYKQGAAVYKTDPAQAFGLFVQAADAGNVSAMVGVGHCYETGTGTVTNHAKAIDWYEKAVDHNSLKACEGLAHIYATCSDPQFHDGEKAVKYASVVARKKSHDAEALSLLAAAYARNMEFDKAVEVNDQACTSARSASLVTELRRRDKFYYANGIAYPASAKQEAIVLALEVVEKDASEENLENLAMAYFNDGQLDKATQYKRKVSGLRAIVLALEMVEKDASDENLKNLAMAYFYDGQLDKAVEYLGRISGFHEQNLMDKAYAYYRGDSEERYALSAVYYLAAYMNDDSGLAGQWVGSLYEQGGYGLEKNLDKAIEWYHKAF